MAKTVSHIIFTCIVGSIRIAPSYFLVRLYSSITPTRLQIVWRGRFHWPRCLDNRS